MLVEMSLNICRWIYLDLKFASPDIIIVKPMVSELMCGGCGCFGWLKKHVGLA